MKILFTILLVLESVFAFSQTTEIVNILNKELKEEIDYLFKKPNFDGDRITLIKEFSIDNNKILSVEIKKTNKNGYSLERQEVLLSKVKIIGKDINIILETNGKDVKTWIQRFYKNEKKEEFFNEGSMFFTHLNFPNNEYIGDDLIEAFSKAGYNTTKDYWYD